jgi:hypothetical protein
MIPSLATSEGRRFWAFIIMLGASFVFTAFAAVGVWLVSGNAYYSLILALAANVQLLICIGTFGWVLGRRINLEAGANGFKFGDRGRADEVRSAIQAPATAAQDKADELKAEVTSGDKE